MSRESKGWKVRHVIGWLESEHGATVLRVRGAVVIVQAGIRSPAGFPIHDESVAVTVFVASEREVERWFDAAARRMLADGLTQEDALAETWPGRPEDGGAGEVQREETATS